MPADIDNYDYRLPPELIAQEPLQRRADARLMVVDRRTGSIDHSHVRDLCSWFRRGDRLVLNDTKVIPARLVGYRTETQGRWQGLFLAHDEQGFWRILAKTRGRIRVGETVTLVDRLARADSSLRLVAKQDDGVWIAVPEPAEETYQLLARVGRVPLPHYIRAGEMVDADREAYQTVYARCPGSVAAPTAGLHFTDDLLADLQRRGSGVSWVTLHVGRGTFQPIHAEALAEHKMHCEWCELPRETAQAVAECRATGGRVVAVGTTAVRVLETAAGGGPVEPFKGETDLFVRPPYEFRAVDALMTNFHLPRTTLLVLVRTFGGEQLMRRAYDEAIRERYRFYSYGDAMLIV